MIIYLASDHAGFELKGGIKIFLETKGYQVKDLGADSLDDNDDYPDFVKRAAKAVAKNPDEDKAIILGGSGQGEAMVANREKGIRATVYYGGPEEIIRLSKEHNNANVLSIGARFVHKLSMLRLIEDWLRIPFSNEERHIRRINKF